MTQPQLLNDWLATRNPAPPRQLADRIEALCARQAALAATQPGTPVAEQLLDVAEAGMRALLPDGCLTRESAFELLAVDAILTYAFEASADHPERLEEFAATALARIAGLAEPYDA